MFHVYLNEVVTHWSQYFGSLTNAELLSSLDVLGLLQHNMEYKLPPQRLYLVRSGDWRGHSSTLKCFLKSLSFIAWTKSLSWWKTQSCFVFSALTDGRRFLSTISWCMGPFILCSIQICHSVLNYPKHSASTHMLHCGNGVLGISLNICPYPKMVSNIYTKSTISIFDLVWPYDPAFHFGHDRILLWPQLASSHWTVNPMYFLKLHPFWSLH